MVELYLSPSCTSCRKARVWLTKHKVDFKEHNILIQPLSQKVLLDILSKTENGTEDIISMRSKIFQKLKLDVESLSVSELVRLIEKNPSLLRRPIILDDKRMQVGFNEDDIRVFFPRDYRRVELASTKESTE
jgi:regulatory protein spx